MTYPFIKRLLDLVFSIVMLIILSPLLAIVALAIKMESKGPVIFKQRRLGRNGEVFLIYKFRSMIVDAENQGTGQYSFDDDPRVTKVGKIIRKTSIDELPQLVNILKGDMSVIGPRPPLTYHPWPYEDYNEFQKRRFSVRPGVTGWAQIHGRKDILWETRIQYDVFYVDNMSFKLDLKIFMITIVKVLLMKDNVNTKVTVLRKSGMNISNNESEKL